ncbi:GNAT family N-acetyltransferase [Salinispora vitiensis]|uniref:GNAT family N-acetyltransferase n=1 Tax=Salinispora vitiensis TaxID=999544 RepID=UPI001CC5D35B|nr:GNAT family N-acetyltransferase [Salinispora vitiensis]
MSSQPEVCSRLQPEVWSGLQPEVCSGLQPEVRSGLHPAARLDLGATLRALRRRADLSQRELAERSGVPKSTLARIESQPGADPRLRTVERLFHAVGVELVARSPGTAERLGGDPGGAARDEGGRRFPAHLDVRRVRTLADWPGAWWAYWYSLPPERWPLRVPDYTYDLDRRRRDDRRLRQWLPDALRVHRLRDGLPESSWLLVAELPDGRRVGELRAHEQSDDLLLGYDLGGLRSLVLDGVVVAPRLREMGIGRRLIALLRAEMSRAGLRSVHAVARGNGVGFLLACGYQQQRDGLLLALRFDLPDRQSPARPASTGPSAGQGRGDLGEGGESLPEAPGVPVAGPDRIGDGA